MSSPIAFIASPASKGKDKRPCGALLNRPKRFLTLVCVLRDMNFRRDKVSKSRWTSSLFHQSLANFRRPELFRIRSTTT